MIVEVIAGNFKKQQGKVLRFNRKIGYAIVEGINTKKRTLKTNQNKKIQIEKESYIHVSNLKKIGEDNATI